MAAAKEMSTDAVAAVLSDLDGIFTFKNQAETHMP